MVGAAASPQGLKMGASGLPGLRQALQISGLGRELPDKLGQGSEQWCQVGLPAAVRATPSTPMGVRCAPTSPLGASSNCRPGAQRWLLCPAAPKAGLAFLSDSTVSQDHSGILPHFPPHLLPGEPLGQGLLSSFLKIILPSFYKKQTNRTER